MSIKGKITKKELHESVLKLIEESAGSNNSGGASKLVHKKSSTTIRTATNTVAINIPEFNKSSDVLMVYKNSTYIEENEDYTISADGLNIVSTNGNWNTSNQEMTFNFVMIKSVPKLQSGDTITHVVNIKSTEWLYSNEEELYYKDINHNLGTENVFVSVVSTDTKDSVEVVVRYTNGNELRVYNETNMNVTVKLVSATCGNSVEGGSVNQIDDSQINLNSTWSSNKINNELTLINNQVSNLNLSLKEIYVTDIQELEDSLKYSNSVIVLKPQTYTLTNLIDITGVSNITIYGNGSTLKTNNGCYVRISGNSNNIKIDGLVFDGDGVTNISNNHHLWLRDCENVTIINCIFKNLKYGAREGSSLEQINGNDGIYLRSMINDSQKFANKNITIKDCKFYYLSRNGISIIQGSNILIDNCYFASRRAAVDIEPNNTNEISENITVSNCLADGTLSYTCYNSDGTNDSETIQHYAFEVSGSKHSSLYPNFGIDNVIFKNNRIIGHVSNNLTKGIKMSWLKNGIIDGNILKNCTNILSDFVDNGTISLYRFDNGFILNNTIEDYGDSKGIRVYTGNNLICDNNIIRNGNGYGLHLSSINTNNQKISNCIFENCGDQNNSTIYSSKIKLNNCTFTSNKQINDFIFSPNNTTRDSELILNNCTFYGNNNVKYGCRTESGSVKTAKIKNCEFNGIITKTTHLASRDTQTNRLYIFEGNTIINCGLIAFGAYADKCLILNNNTSNTGDGNYVFNLDKSGGVLFTNNSISSDTVVQYGILITLGDMVRTPKIITGNVFKNCTNISYGKNEVDIEDNNILI